KGHGFVPTKAYVKRQVQGWTVRVNRQLLAGKSELGRQALELLDRKLAEVRRTVPARACLQLREVPIWLGVDDGHAPCSEYHPSRDWLRTHGYNPDKARCVEIGNASRFLEWSKDQPSMVLHELAHAYHDRVLGFDNEDVKQAYHQAVASGRYDHVQRNNGKVERAYALTDPQEYFAEASEAYFGRNDFYPFDRHDLQKHDPNLFRLLDRVWGD
ncbi:MAG: zinc-dependent peptidase, partial [Isosphaeraceae bacterium]